MDNLLNQNTEDIEDTEDTKTANFNPYLSKLADSQPYATMRSGSMTSELRRTNVPLQVLKKASKELSKGLKEFEYRNRKIERNLGGDGYIVRGKNLTLVFQGVEAKGFTQQMSQFLAYLLMKYTSNATEEIVNGDKMQYITVTTEDYAKLRGISNDRQARRELLSVIRCLLSVKIIHKHIDTKGNTIFMESPSFFTLGHLADNSDDTSFKSCCLGKVKRIYIPSSMSEMIKKESVILYNKNLIRLNSKEDKTAYHLGSYLCEHKFSNAGRANENRITIKTLLERCENIPTLEEVMKGDRAIKRTIIDPFLEGLACLCHDPKGIHMIKSYKFLVKNAHLSGRTKFTEISEEQASNLSYPDFIELFVNFELNEYPETSLLYKNKQKRNNKNQ